MVVYDEAGDMPVTWIKVTELPHAALELQEHGLMRVRRHGSDVWSLSLTEMGAAVAGKLWREHSKP